jgi:hypothetical protein
VLWAVGRYNLHLSESELQSIKLEQFNALLDRWESEQEWENYRVALICSVLCNINKGKNTKAFSPKDFMPYKQKPKQQTPQEMLNIIQGFQMYHDIKGEKNGR